MCGVGASTALHMLLVSYTNADADALTSRTHTPWAPMRLRLRIRCGDAPSVPKRISPVNWAREKMKALRQCQAEHRHRAQAQQHNRGLYMELRLVHAKSTVRASVQLAETATTVGCSEGRKTTPVRGWRRDALGLRVLACAVAWLACNLAGKYPAHTSPSEGEPAMDVLEQQAVGATLRLMTYNVHSGVGMDGVYDVERIGRVVAGANPDVLCLQEVESNSAPRAPVCSWPCTIFHTLLHNILQRKRTHC